MEGLDVLGRLGLEGLVDRVTAWRAVKRFFAEFFSFLFDNTLACYLVFAFSLPLLLCFTFIICCSYLCTRVVLLVYCASFTLVSHLDKLE